MLSQFNGLKAGHNIRAVSYTHLDVYKRQFNNQPYSFPYLFIEEIDKSALQEILISSLMKVKGSLVKQLYRNLFYLLELDPSSIKPYFKIKNESSLVPEMFEKIIPEQELEIDVVVRIPPIRERSVRVKVKTVEKAVPNIVGPGAF